MILPVQITYRNVEPSSEIETWIQEEAAKLDTYYDRITSCRVVVEAPHRRRRTANPYHVRIDLGVPGEELVVNHQPSLYGRIKGHQEEKRVKRLEVQSRYKDLHAAITDSFKAAKRRLDEFAERQRHGQSKDTPRRPSPETTEI